MRSDMEAEFCLACGASFPNREGEGRCAHCIDAAKPVLKRCDRCVRVSQYEEKCAADGGTFHEIPMCALEVVEGKLVCAEPTCRAEYEPVPDGMTLLKACGGDK